MTARCWVYVSRFINWHGFLLCWNIYLAIISSLLTMVTYAKYQSSKSRKTTSLTTFFILSQFPKFHKVAIFFQNDVRLQHWLPDSTRTPLCVFPASPIHATSSYLPCHYFLCHSFVFHWVYPAIMSLVILLSFTEILWHQWQSHSTCIIYYINICFFSELCSTRYVPILIN